jgi:hypothetical protein
MPAEITTGQVWQLIEKELFAVIGMVKAEGQARTAGIVYAVHQGKVVFGTGKDTWKTRHIAGNSHISVTIPLAKRIPIMPWIKIPAATITFCGTARVFPAADASPDLLQAVFQHMADDREMVDGSCLIAVTPEKDFITYGVGVSLMAMRDPQNAGGRAAVA